MRYSIAHTMIAAVVLLSLGNPVRAKEAPPKQLVAQILNDWDTRQKQIQTIRYKLSGTWFHPKGKFDGGYRYNSTQEDKKLLASKGGHIPPKDTTLPHQVNVLLDLNRNWARKELQWYKLHHALAEFAPHHTTHLYNGKTNKMYEPRDQNKSSGYTPSPIQPDLAIINGGGNSPTFFQTEDYPILWACGGIQSGGLVPGSLRSSYTTSTIQFHGKGKIDGHECVILHTRVSDPVAKVWREYWVDQSRDSAVLRCIGHFEGKREFQIDANYQNQDGRWVPGSWRCSYYESDGLYQEFNQHADEIVINPSVQESDFDVSLKSGMVVSYPVKDQIGVVASDGHTLLPLSQIQNQEPSSVWWRVALLSVIVVTVMTITAWRVRRRRHKSVEA